MQGQDALHIGYLRHRKHGDERESTGDAAWAEAHRSPKQEGHKQIELVRERALRRGQEGDPSGDANEGAAQGEGLDRSPTGAGTQRLQPADAGPEQDRRDEYEIGQRITQEPGLPHWPVGGTEGCTPGRADKGGEEWYCEHRARDVEDTVAQTGEQWSATCEAIEQSGGQQRLDSVIKQVNKQQPDGHAWSQDRHETDGYGHQHVDPPPPWRCQQERRQQHRIRRPQRCGDGQTVPVEVGRIVAYGKQEHLPARASAGRRR